MFDTLTKNDWTNLLVPRRGLCLSLYMPTPHAGLENFQNPIRLKTLLAESEERLSGMLGNRAEVEEFLHPVRKVLDDGDLWQKASEGLALFRSAEIMTTWRLPVTFGSFAWIGSRFYIRPLLPLIRSDKPYYLLAVSQNGVRLFAGSQWHSSEVQIDSLPGNLAKALNYHQPEWLFEVQSANRVLPGKEGGVFHGQGVASQHQKNDLLAYFRIIDRALHGFLHNRQAPLVFAGVDYLFSIYRQANTYPHLWGKPVDGNPQGLSAADLHRRVSDLLRPYWQRDSIEDVQRIQRARGRSRAATSIGEILQAAAQGRVDALIISVDEPCWGRFESATGHVELRAPLTAGSEDLLDLAAYLTLAHGGRVHAMNSADLGDTHPAIALLRYELPAPVATSTNP